MLRVSQAYFDVLGAQDTLQTTRANKAAISEQLASAKRNFEVGTATITDTREAQARFDLATAQEIAADNDLVTKRIALDQLVGRSNVQPQPARRAGGAAGDGGDPGRRPRRPRGRGASGGAPRAASRFDVAQLETEKARAQRLPTRRCGGLGAERARHDRRRTSPATTRSAASACRSTCRSTAAARSRTGSSETLVLEERSRNDLEAARRAVTQATRQAYYTLQSSAAQVKALEAAEASSQLALEATQLGYRVGIRVNVDVLNAQSQLYQTRRDLARARYDVLLGTLRLRQASGRLVPSDILGIDALLVR